MKKVFFFSSIVLLSILVAVPGYAQNFKAKQQEQEKAIKYAYKKKKITELEYNKLMREQEIIKQTIEDYNVDKVLTSKEKNAIHSKLLRAQKRLRKYKTNSEVY